MPEKINLNQKLSLFTEHWRPKLIGELNGQQVKLVKVQGEFPWHHHDDQDELFLVISGAFRVEFRSHTVQLAPGELIIVPRGVEHRTAADEEASVLIFEPSGVCNTGNVENSDFTAPNEVWI